MFHLLMRQFALLAVFAITFALMSTACQDAVFGPESTCGPRKISLSIPRGAGAVFSKCESRRQLPWHLIGLGTVKQSVTIIVPVPVTDEASRSGPWYQFEILDVDADCFDALESGAPWPSDLRACQDVR